MKTIEIIVSPCGGSTIETKGFAGSSCQQASRFLEEALGNRLGERLTPEWFQGQTSHQSNIQRE